ncbi:MAG: peptide chain release factor 2, partial [Firmicutes bacterium]|nr:peptide chain release factor 2 [Bacillota bacterium]
RRPWGNSGRAFDVDKKRARLEEINYESGLPGFWDDQERAQKTIKERGALESDLGEYDACEELLSDAKTLMEMAEEADDEDAAKEAADTFEAFNAKADEVHIRALLSDEYDQNNALVNIHPGAGGVDAQDWAEMLLRMYTRWSEKKGYKVKILDYQNDTEGGIKNVEILVEGPLAYGYLKTESGVHRLVRISPFNAAGKRQTSFALVDVMPELPEDIQVDIDPGDLRIDTYRSSGAGGQHVNKTDSAVRITHLPTNIVVSCQNERSQHQNKEYAMRMLYAKLYALAKQEHKDKIGELHGDYGQIAWGSQIRSYVFQPYTMVKDHRTGCETSNVNAVMDGAIDDFIYASLNALQKGEL